jgi:hypothetical protein
MSTEGVKRWVENFQILNRVIDDIGKSQKDNIWNRLYLTMAMSTVSVYRTLNNTEKELFDKELQKDEKLQTQFEYLTRINSNRGRYFDITNDRLEMLKHMDNLYIYGAGAYAKDLNGILSVNHIEINGFIESDLNGEKVFMNKKVYNLSEADPENSMILIGVSPRYYDEILEVLNRGGYKVFQL